jgi:hypothetical protein
MTNPELIERVANAIKYSRSDEQGGWNYAAIAAIAAVRSYDCEVGPSEAEIDAARGAILSTGDFRKGLRLAAYVKGGHR